MFKFIKSWFGKASSKVNLVRDDEPTMVVVVRNDGTFEFYGRQEEVEDTRGRVGRREYVAINIDEPPPARIAMPQNTTVSNKEEEVANKKTAITPCNPLAPVEWPEHINEMLREVVRDLQEENLRSLHLKTYIQSVSAGVKEKTQYEIWDNIPLKSNYDYVPPLDLSLEVEMCTVEANLGESLIMKLGWAVKQFFGGSKPVAFGVGDVFVV